MGWVTRAEGSGWSEASPAHALVLPDRDAAYHSVGSFATAAGRGFEPSWPLDWRPHEHRGDFERPSMNVTALLPARPASQPHPSDRREDETPHDTAIDGSPFGKGATIAQLIKRFRESPPRSPLEVQRQADLWWRESLHGANTLLFSAAAKSVETTAALPQGADVPPASSSGRDAAPADESFGSPDSSTSSSSSSAVALVDEEEEDVLSSWRMRNRALLLRRGLLASLGDGNTSGPREARSSKDVSSADEGVAEGDAKDRGDGPERVVARPTSDYPSFIAKLRRRLGMQIMEVLNPEEASEASLSDEEDRDGADPSSAGAPTTRDAECQADPSASVPAGDDYGGPPSPPAPASPTPPSSPGGPCAVQAEEGEDASAVESLVARVVSEHLFASPTALDFGHPVDDSAACPPPQAPPAPLLDAGDVVSDDVLSPSAHDADAMVAMLKQRIQTIQAQMDALEHAAPSDPTTPEVQED